MPSRRSRSRSRSPSRRRSESPERRVELPKGVSPISESDYFQKSDEFRLWLKEEKGKVRSGVTELRACKSAISDHDRKYFDGLSGERARSYFRKFIKAWNRGKLPRSYYDGIEPGSIPATTNTAYKWSFASKKTRVDDDALRAARADVGAATYGQIPLLRLSHDTGPSTSGTHLASSGRIQGPAMPSAADLTLARELTKEQREEERAYQKKREKLDAKDRLEEMVGPKPVGKEALMEKKRAKREGDRSFRERGDDGLELDESTLMGGGDSFREQMARRDSNKSRFSQKAEEKQNVMRERSSVYKEKEKATMDMFQQLAKQRFG